MSNTLRILGIAAFMAVSASAFLPGQASALSMSECSVKFKAAKAADPNTPAWNDFRKAQCGTDAAATAPAATPAATKKPKAKTTAVVTTPMPSGSFMADCSANWKAMGAAGTRPAGMKWKDYITAKCPAPAATTAASDAPKMSMAQCSAAWKTAKAAGSVPEGFTWNKFRSAGCTVTGATAASTAGAVKPSKTVSLSPPEPTAVDNSPIPTVDKNGKALSAGQIAAIKRIKQCGAMWQQAKASNKLPAVILALDTKSRWPQYWSMCNKQLKAKGHVSPTAN